MVCPIVYKVSSIPHGAGFHPPTVLILLKNPLDWLRDAGRNGKSPGGFGSLILRDNFFRLLLVKPKGSQIFFVGFPQFLRPEEMFRSSGDAPGFAAFEPLIELCGAWLLSFFPLRSS